MTENIECGRWNRLMKKRELLAYYVLCREDGRVWNTGSIIDKLMNDLLFNRKTAFSVLRRLKRIGVLIPIDKTSYRCIGFEKFFEELYKNYICRKKRRLNPV